jgi:hypothetical protein
VKTLVRPMGISISISTLSAKTVKRFIAYH